MNIKQSLMICSISLLFSSLNAAPFVYVANGSDSSFSVIDQATGAAIAGSPFTVPNSANLVGVAIASDNKTAYMIDQPNNTLIAIDVATNNILSTTGLNPGPTDQATAIAINGSTAYIGFSSLFTFRPHLLPIDIADPSAPVLGTPIDLNVGGFISGLESLVISNNVAYVTVFYTPDLTNPAYAFWAIDLASLTQNNYVSMVPDKSRPYGIAIDTAQNKAYVAFYGLNEVQPFDLAPAPSGLPITVGAGPSAILIDALNEFAYVANQNGSSVSVIELSSSTVVATINGVDNQPGNPVDMVLSTDGKTLYVATGANGNNTVTPIDVATRTVGTPIPVGAGAYALAVANFVTGPTDVVGIRKNNVFLLQTAQFLEITWTASIDSAVVAYNIYKGTELVGNVLATSPLAYTAFVPSGATVNNFFVTAVNASGVESIPVQVRV